MFVKTSLVLQIKKLGSFKQIVFADFSGQWDFSTFNNFSTKLLPLSLLSSSILSYLTKILVALFNKFVDEQILSISENYFW